jgi:hypothetical protein
VRLQWRLDLETVVTRKQNCETLIGVQDICDDEALTCWGVQMAMTMLCQCRVQATFNLESFCVLLTALDQTTMQYK